MYEVDIKLLFVTIVQMKVNIMTWLLLLMVLGLLCWGLHTRKLRLTSDDKLKECQTKYASLLEKAKEIEVKAKTYKAQISDYQNQLNEKQAKLVALSRFEPIEDIHQAVLELEKRKILVNSEIVEAEKKRDEIIEEGRADAMVLRQQGQKNSLEIIERARQSAAIIESQAHQNAKNIVGDAYETMQNHEKVKKEIRAIENRILGYGDEYLVPGSSVLDDLAELWEHKEAGSHLKECRKKSKDMVKSGMAALCDYAEPHRQQTAIQFVIDAFNGRVDSILARVKHDNYGKLRQEILDVFAIVNRNGEAFRNARITETYMNLRIDELKWAVATYELMKQDQEEQKRIRDAIREEQQVLKEAEKAQRDAENEAIALEKAMKLAEQKLRDAHADERAHLEAELARLQGKLSEAEEKGRRAISQAQQTRRGYVYVISNIGSFGESIYKIGLTRRLEPLERIRELGDASVPFHFDVHAMIYSEDAPALEDNFHKHFANNAVNLVNSYKEFYNVQLSEIRKLADEVGVDAQWTMRAEAAEYRESCSIRDKMVALSTSDV